MMERASKAWGHNQVKDAIVNAANDEIYSTRLLASTCKSGPCSSPTSIPPPPWIDRIRVVRMFLRDDNVPLTRSYPSQFRG